MASIPYLQANGASVSCLARRSMLALIPPSEASTSTAPLQITPNWSISGGVSYADGKIDNDTVPCRDSNFDGIPDTGTPTFNDFRSRNIHIATCKSKPVGLALNPSVFQRHTAPD
ncbi:hypothetical protein ACRAWD_27575 [Caulobacter segnis]